MKNKKLMYRMTLFVILFGFIGFTSLSFSSPLAAQTSDAVVLRVMPDQAEVVAGEVTEVAVEVVDVQDLYAVDIELRFDPQAVEIVDADPAKEGVQVALGTFMDPGFVIRNAADNTQGRLRFVMTQVRPSEPKTGEGVVLVIRLRGKQPGAVSPIDLLAATLARDDTSQIEPTLRSGEIQVLSAAGTDPTQTPLPAQNPDISVTVTPTLIPPTPTPLDTPTSIPAREPASDEPTETPQPTPTPATLTPTITPGLSQATETPKIMPTEVTSTPSPESNATADETKPAEVSPTTNPVQPTSTAQLTEEVPLLDSTPTGASGIPAHSVVEGETPGRFPALWGLGGLGFVLVLTGGWFVLRHYKDVSFGDKLE